MEIWWSDWLAIQTLFVSPDAYLLIGCDVIEVRGSNA